ncbi:hypothetical protein NIES4106_32490 [Fischerella sp. NIES-4106]|nr:hypothetical protein NIES4106_32490 [Fischerella sp. NIES-4106]
METLKSRSILIRYSLSTNEKIGFEILLSKMKQPCLKKGGTRIKVPLKKGDLGGSEDLCVHRSLPRGGAEGGGVLYMRLHKEMVLVI